MKKLIGTLVAAMLAAAVFADIGIGGFGRGFFVPIAYDGAVKMANAVGWDMAAPRVGISVGGSSDNIGFGLDIKGDGGALAVNDNAFIWAKPCDWFKITIGQWFDDTLRGSCYFGTWDWVRSSVTLGDDLTFARIFNTKSGTGMFGSGTYDPMRGALLSLMPVDGLYVAAGLNISYASIDWGAGGIVTPAPKAVDCLKWGQYQVGYTVDGVVAVKGQYIGQGDGGVINVAADILAVEGSKISIGAFIPTKFKDGAIGISATYNGSFDALSVGAYVAASLAGDGAKAAQNIGVAIGAGIGYGLDDGMSIDADVRVAIDAPKGGSVATGISVGAYFNKGFSNGGLGVGVIAAFGAGATPKINNFDAAKFSLAIPVRLQYWF